MELITTQTMIRMSSKEMSEVTEKRHDNVKRTIDTLAESGLIAHPQIEDGEKAANGVVEKVYFVGKRDSYVVVAQLSPEFTARLVDRWQELEAQIPKFDPTALSTMDILSIAMESEKGRLLAIEQRDKAIATKAQIGSKREATAMANVAKANKEVTRLMDRLGFNARHATIKAVEGAVKRSFGPQGWRPLSNWCKANGATAIDVPDPLYGSVKSWPADAWGEIYDVDLKALFPATETAVGA